MGRGDNIIFFFSSPPPTNWQHYHLDWQISHMYRLFLVNSAVFIFHRWAYNVTSFWKQELVSITHVSLWLMDKLCCQEVQTTCAKTSGYFELCFSSIHNQWMILPRLFSLYQPEWLQLPADRDLTIEAASCWDSWGLRCWKLGSQAKHVDASGHVQSTSVAGSLLATAREHRCFFEKPNPGEEKAWLPGQPNLSWHKDQTFECVTLFLVLVCLLISNLSPIESRVII